MPRPPPASPLRRQREPWCFRGWRWAAQGPGISRRIPDRPLQEPGGTLDVGTREKGNRATLQSGRHGSKRRRDQSRRFLVFRQPRCPCRRCPPQLSREFAMCGFGVGGVRNVRRVAAKSRAGDATRSSGLMCASARGRCANLESYYEALSGNANLREAVGFTVESESEATSHPPFVVVSSKHSRGRVLGEEGGPGFLLLPSWAAAAERLGRTSDQVAGTNDAPLRGLVNGVSGASQH